MRVILVENYLTNNFSILVSLSFDLINSTNYFHFDRDIRMLTNIISSCLTATIASAIDMRTINDMTQDLAQTQVVGGGLLNIHFL